MVISFSGIMVFFYLLFQLVASFLVFQIVIYHIFHFSLFSFLQETSLAILSPLLTNTKVDYISNLPDCILFHILSILPSNDLLATSVLSKRWHKLLREIILSRHLKFDVFNVLGSEEELLEKGYITNVLDYKLVNSNAFSSEARNEYVKRVDIFIKNFKGTKIDSFLVEFYLKQENSSNIDQWINFAITRGVRRIHLLLQGKFSRSNVVHHSGFYGRYKFPFDLFSKPGHNSTLKYIHLRYCLVYQERNFDISPFTNLRSLVLEDSQVDETLLKTLLNDCHLLQELSLIRCDFNTYTLNIKSSSLCLLKLEDCMMIRWDKTRINTPELKSIHLGTSMEEIAEIFPHLATLPQLEILNLNIGVTLINIDINLIKLFNIKDFTLKNLKELHLIYGPDTRDIHISWLSTILQACPLLHKLSIMITCPLAHSYPSKIRDVNTFTHDEIKVIEVGGCVGNLYEIEIAMNALKYFHKLQRIVLSPYWINKGVKTRSPTWFKTGREKIFQKLQGEGIRLDKLVLIT